MNPTINLGSGTGLVLGVVAAGLILGYGVWTGQRSAGLRGALGVLLTTLLCGLPPLLLATLHKQLAMPLTMPLLLWAMLPSLQRTLRKTLPSLLPTPLQLLLPSKPRTVICVAGLRG